MKKIMYMVIIGSAIATGMLNAFIGGGIQVGPIGVGAGVGNGVGAGVQVGPVAIGAGVGVREPVYVQEPVYYVEQQPPIYVEQEYVEPMTENQLADEGVIQYVEDIQ